MRITNTCQSEYANGFRFRHVYTAGDLSRLFSVSVGTAGKMADSGVIPAWKIPGSRHRRIDHVALVRWLSERPEYGAILDRLRAAEQREADKRK